MDYDKLKQAIDEGIKCASCTYTTIAKKPTDMHCPWCYQEQCDKSKSGAGDLSPAQAIYIFVYLLFSAGFAFFIGRYCFPYSSQ